MYMQKASSEPSTVRRRLSSASPIAECRGPAHPDVLVCKIYPVKKWSCRCINRSDTSATLALSLTSSRYKSTDKCEFSNSSGVWLQPSEDFCAVFSAPRGERRRDIRRVKVLQLSSSRCGMRAAPPRLITGSTLELLARVHVDDVIMMQTGHVVSAAGTL
jgi:hypothetical protein